MLGMVLTGSVDAVEYFEGFVQGVPVRVQRPVGTPRIAVACSLSQQSGQCQAVAAALEDVALFDLSLMMTVG